MSELNTPMVSISETKARKARNLRVLEYNPDTPYDKNYVSLHALSAVYKQDIEAYEKAKSDLRQTRRALRLSDEITKTELLVQSLALEQKRKRLWGLQRNSRKALDRSLTKAHEDPMYQQAVMRDFREQIASWWPQISDVNDRDPIFRHTLLSARADTYRGIPLEDNQTWLLNPGTAPNQLAMQNALSELGLSTNFNYQHPTIIPPLLSHHVPKRIRLEDMIADSLHKVAYGITNVLHGVTNAFRRRLNLPSQNPI
jgi:hypothetical protein